MAATATTPVRSRPARERRSLPRREGGRAFEPGRATLDDRIAILWTQLSGTGKAECPVCAAELSAGRPCGACGSELS